MSRKDLENLEKYAGIGVFFTESVYVLASHAN